MEKYGVLFLCIGNSCRSQMAEAIVNAAPEGRWAAFSAGTEPAGYVHPMAIRALAEMGIAHQGVSKSVAQFRDQKFDLVITVCEEAAENCPVWLGSGKKLHFSFPDPAIVKGTEQEKMAAFRQVRDGLQTKIIAALEQYQTALASVDY